MAPPVTITFLGTASAVPSHTRNHSSLAITLPSGASYLFDCGEATQHQLQKINGFKSSRIGKIFITHMHGDHVFGLAPLMSSLLNGAGGTDPSLEDPRVLNADTPKPAKADIELYGPLGLRQYLRSIFATTYTHLGGYYVVHELHFPIDTLTVGLDLNERELPGKNVLPDQDGFWRNICSSGGGSEWEVSAGPIRHSIPCLGFVLTEPPLLGKFTPEYRQRLLANKLPISYLGNLSKAADGEGIDLPDGTVLHKPPPRRGRKITVLGDTNDPASIAGLASGSDVLIHEATNACLPPDVYSEVEEKTRAHGHSTPEMAARFARSITLGSGSGVVDGVVAETAKGKGKAEKDMPKGVLLLNHFSSRYADPRSSDEAKSVMDGIRECAVQELQKSLSKNKGEAADMDVLCAYDLMQYEIRARD